MRWLSRFIEDVRVVEPAADGILEARRLPDGRTTLAVRVFDGGGDVSVSGPRTRAVFKRTTGMTSVVIVSLKPGWAVPLFGVAASALTDRYVKVEDLWGGTGAALRDEVLAAASPGEMLDRLSHAIDLRSRGTREPASGRLARRAVRLLEGDEVRVDRVAKQLGVSSRHLRRAFTESIGIGPKDFARAVRLPRAVQRATMTHDWGRIAADVGYYDQAHLISEFRELVGLTPGAFVKR
ncbi:MAG: AraC family transcriptional regulator [Kofleriaceae bacterium]